MPFYFLLLKLAGGQFELIMQNKPNLSRPQMNVSKVLEMAYENKHNWTLGENKPNQSQFQTRHTPKEISA